MGESVKAKTSNGASLEALEKQYLFLNASMPALKLKGATDKEMDEAGEQVEQARKNYWDSVNKAFQENDPKVASLVSQMNAEQAKLQDSLSKLKKVADILKVITKAVDVGSQLAAKAVAL